MLKTVQFTKLERAQAGKAVVLVVYYKESTGKFAGQEMKVRGLASKLPQEAKDLLQNTKAGQNLTVEIIKEGNYWNLTDIKPEGTPTTQSNHQPSAYTKTYDNVGVKVGASRNQAIAFLSATKGKNFTLDDVDETAKEIVKRQAKQEEELTNTPKEPTKETWDITSGDDTTFWKE